MDAKKTRRPYKRTKPEDLPLKDKQMAFATWYVSAAVNMNGTEAARRAGYKGNDNTLAQVAKENLRKVHIRAEIDRRLVIALSGADVTVENVLRKLQVIGAAAFDNAKFGPAVRAAELEGRYLKMFTDKIEHMSDVDDMSYEDLERLLIEITEAGGVDLSKLFTQHESADGDGDHRPPDATTH